MSDIHLGDVVMLKSGGPDMTVSQIHGDQIVCVWGLETGLTASATFSRPMLILKPRGKA